MKNLTVSEEYKENFLVADATFVHQVVFDTIKKTLTHLHEVGDNAQYCTNAGEIFDEAQAFQLAIGNLNPLNMERIDNWDHSERLVSSFLQFCSISFLNHIRRLKTEQPTVITYV